jgi:hypothetical protein
MRLCRGEVARPRHQIAVTARGPRHHQQLRELRGYAADFPALFEPRAELVDQVLARFGLATAGRASA